MSSGQNRSLRRSARAPKKIAKQISEFNVGDVVEVSSHIVSDTNLFQQLG
jgi:hypothetical protein